MVSIIWAIVAFLILVYFWWANRLLAREAEADRFDAGLAIIEFGRAFPDEAIRQVVSTEDGGMFFLRLWSGKAGCMRANGRHFQCQIIESGAVRVSEDADPSVLTVEFVTSPIPGGRLRFRSPREASEVGLWLLGSFIPAAAEIEGLASA